MSKHSIISHTVYCISTSAFIRPITRQKETKGLRLQQQQFKTSVSAACLCSSLWGIWLDKIYTSCSLDYRSDDIKQIFVTWIVTRTAALHPGFGLNWTKGPWTRVCIIIHSSFLMSNVFFFDSKGSNVRHSLQPGYSSCACCRICGQKYFVATVSVSVRVPCL